MQRANRKIPGAWVLSRYWQENKGKASPNTEMKSWEKKKTKKKTNPLACCPLSLPLPELPSQGDHIISWQLLKPLI